MGRYQSNSEIDSLRNLEASAPSSGKKGGLFSKKSSHRSQPEPMLPPESADAAFFAPRKPEEDFAELLETRSGSYFAEHINEILKKQLFGGYSKKSIISYVEGMDNAADLMRDNLERQIKDISAERAMIADECQVLRKQMSQMEATRDEAVDELDRIQDEEQELKRELQTALDERDELLARIEETQAAYDSVSAEKGETAETGSFIDEEEADELCRHIVELEQQVAEYEAARKDLEARLADRPAQEEAPAWHDVAPVESNQSFEYRELSESLQARIAELDDLNESLMARIAERDALNEYLAARIAEMAEKSAVSTEETSRQAYQAESDRAVLLARAYEAEGRLEDAQTANAELSDQVDSLQRMLNKQKDEFDARYSSLHDRYSYSLNKCEELEADKEALGGLVSEYQERERRLVLAATRNEECLQVIADLEGIVENLLNEMEQQAAQYRELEAAQEEYRDKVWRISGEKAELQMKNVELLERIDSLSEEARDYRRRYEQMLENGNAAQDVFKEEKEPARVFQPSEKARSAVERARNISKIYSIERPVATR